MKIFVTTMLLCFAFISNSNAYIPNSTCPAGFDAGPTMTTSTCELSLNLGFVQIWTGETTITTSCMNPLTLEIFESVSTTGCGKNGGSWDWFWE